jgi:hypothetical protein
MIVMVVMVDVVMVALVGIVMRVPTIGVQKVVLDEIMVAFTCRVEEHVSVNMVRVEEVDVVICATSIMKGL